MTDQSIKVYKYYSINYYVTHTYVTLHYHRKKLRYLFPVEKRKKKREKKKRKNLDVHSSDYNIFRNTLKSSYWRKTHDKYFLERNSIYTSDLIWRKFNLASSVNGHCKITACFSHKESFPSFHLLLSHETRWKESFKSALTLSIKPLVEVRDE